MKRFYTLSIALILCALACDAPLSSAQSRRTRGSSAEIAVPLPSLPEDWGEPQPTTGTDEGKVFECVDEKKANAVGDASVSAATKEEGFTGAEVTTKAVITSKPMPRYTEEARINGTSGVVRLRLLLSATGRVSSVSVVRGLPDGLTRTATAAACRIRFTPAVKDGREVSQYVTLEYGFHLDARPIFIQRRPRFYAPAGDFVFDDSIFATSGSDAAPISFRFPACRLPRLRLFD